jgi:hypothetical protein
MRFEYQTRVLVESHIPLSAEDAASIARSVSSALRLGTVAIRSPVAVKTKRPIPRESKEKLVNDEQRTKNGHFDLPRQVQVPVL